MPKVSIIMPCFNAEKYLEESLDSILNQTYTDFEFIIIDDGSEDNSFHILEKYSEKDKRVQLYRNKKNQGVTYTRNRAFGLCRGEYIALMDADDISPLDRIAFEVRYLEEHEDITCVNGAIIKMSEDGHLTNKYNVDATWKQVMNPLEVKANLIFHNVCANSSVMFRRSFIEEKKLSYRNYSCMSDYDFWCGFVAAGGKIVSVSKILQFYRIVNSGITVHTTGSEIRKSIYDEIHKRYLEGIGIVLSEKRLNDYLIFTNGTKGIILTAKDSIVWRRILKQIIRESKGLDCYQEIADYCRMLWEKRKSWLFSKNTL